MFADSVESGNAEHAVVIMEVQGNVSFVVADDDDRMLFDGVYPVAEFVSVGDGRAEAEESDVFGAEDDAFFPNGAAFGVVDKVYFVEDDVADAVEAIVLGDGHVAEDFSGHNEDGRVRVFDDVAGEQADFVFAVFVDEVFVFLVGECFDGRGVDDAGVCLNVSVDDVVCDERFA